MTSSPKHSVASTAGRGADASSTFSEAELSTVQTGAATLARGLRLLEAFQQKLQPLTHGELATLSGLTPATVTRLAGALERLGYLRRRADRRWELTPSVLSLGYPKLATSRIRRFAQPYLLEIARLGDVSVAVAEAVGLSMVFIDTCTVSAAAPIRLDIGERRNMVDSAVGHAYLGSVPDEERARLTAALRARHRKEWRSVARRIDAARGDLDERGFVYADGDSVHDAQTVAAPLVTGDDRVLVVNCVAPQFAISEARMLHEIGPRIVVLCRLLNDLR